jgi:hypothetical protein
VARVLVRALLLFQRRGVQGQSPPQLSLISELSFGSCFGILLESVHLQYSSSIQIIQKLGDFDAPDYHAETLWKKRFLDCFCQDQYICNAVAAFGSLQRLGDIDAWECLVWIICFHKNHHWSMLVWKLYFTALCDIWHVCDCDFWLATFFVIA